MGPRSWMARGERSASARSHASQRSSSGGSAWRSSWVWRATGGTMRYATPTRPSAVTRTAARRPTLRGRRRRRWSVSVIAPRYSENRTEMKSSSSTSATLYRNSSSSTARIEPVTTLEVLRLIEESGPILQLGVLDLSILLVDAGRPELVVAGRRGVAGAAAGQGRRRGGGGCGQAEALLEREQALVDVVGDLEPCELALERIAGERLADLGGGERAALGLLDALGHAVEGLERGAVGETGHGLVDPLLGLRALLLGDEEVLLALGLLDLVVQLAQRALELLGLHRLALPGLLEGSGALGVLLLPQQRLAGEVVPAFAHGEHGAVLPLGGLLPLLLDLRLELALVGDRDGDLLLGARELLAHVDDHLVEDLLRVLAARDRVVDVGADEQRQTLQDAHGASPHVRPGRARRAPGDGSKQRKRDSRTSCAARGSRASRRRARPKGSGRFPRCRSCRARCPSR